MSWMYVHGGYKHDELYLMNGLIDQTNPMQSQTGFGFACTGPDTDLAIPELKRH